MNVSTECLNQKKADMRKMIDEINYLIFSKLMFIDIDSLTDKQLLELYGSVYTLWLNLQSLVKEE